jgi:pimeloyl-ACP methyl ester carboxylesterase
MAVIYAIPGFGCTEPLFEFISVPGHSITVLKWPVPRKEYTLRDYARAFLPQIDTSAPFYLMGVSFGGMLCAELAEMLEAQKTILISSARNRTELPAPVRVMKYLPVHRLLSEKLLIGLAMRSRFIIGFPKKLMPVFREMLRQMPAGYFKYCTSYISEWERRENTKTLVCIHGNSDRLLWIGNIKKVDFTVPRGTHAMVVMRAAEINEILAKII